MAINVEDLNLDSLGRVVLTDIDLDGLGESLGVTFAGGANDSCHGTNAPCTNSDCTGSSNTGCSNSSCDFSTNGHNCSNHVSR